MLSVTLPSPGTQTALAGAPLNVALNGSDSAGDAVSYTVSVDSSGLTNSSVSSPQLTATVMPQSNPTMTIGVTGTNADGTTFSGNMVFSLFSNYVSDAVSPISKLVGEGFYNGLQFFRVINTFMGQTGSPTNDGQGGSGTNFDDDYNSNLQFTGPGLLALANSGPDTNSSQFFITSPEETSAYTSGDFRYTIIGYLLSGSNILTDIMNVPVTTNSTTGFPDPNNPVTMTSVTMGTDSQEGVLQLSAPSGTTGTATVTVTATSTADGGASTMTTFTVDVGALGYTDPPYIDRPVSTITTTAGTSVNFTIPATDVNGNAITYAATPSSTSTMTLTQSATTPSQWTLNATTAGVYSVTESVTAASPVGSENTAADTEAVPVYVDPAAPSISLVPGTGATSTTVTNLNNTAGKTLTFVLSGLTIGANVQIFSDGTLIGSQSDVSTTSVDVTTNGTFTLTPGSHTITATQTLEDQTVSVGNLSTTTNLASPAATLSITVDTTPPQFTSTPVTPATLAVAYSYQLATATDSAGTVTYSLVSPVSGMSINSSDQLVWTPATGQGPAVNVDVQATDPAGNTAQQQFTIDVATPNNAPVLIPASPSPPSLGTIDLNTPLVVPLTSFINNVTGTFINNASGTTTITDQDPGAVVGGIAVTAAVGNGAWKYSLDGTTFSDFPSVSPTSALLLPKNAQIEYDPTGDTAAEMATILYNAWDTTSGTPGGTADLTTTGDPTAFSVSSDAALVTVNDVTDSVILTAAYPSLGSTTANTGSGTPASTAIPLISFINNATAPSTTITDNDTAPGNIALTGVTGSGTWAYSLDGTNFTPISADTLSTSNAILLPETAILQYTPSSESEKATITYCGWDGVGTPGGPTDTTTNGGSTDFSLLSDTASLTVNDAPVLTAVNNPLPLGTTASTVLSIPLSTFIKNGTGSTGITDADSNAEYGIALTGTTGDGTWAYELSGQTTYTDVGTLSTSNALLLPITASLQYTPAFDAKTATITYCAWDQTTGQAGTTADTTANSGPGGTTAFSAATDTRSLTVNDAPVLTAASPSLGSITTTITASTATPIDLSSFINNPNATSTTITYPDSKSTSTLGSIAVTAVVGNGTWEYALSGGTFQDISPVSPTAPLLLPQNAQIEYIPKLDTSETGSNAPSITYCAWDQTSGEPGTIGVIPATNGTGGATAFSTATDTATLTVNDAPTLTGAAPSLGSMTAYTGTATSLTLNTQTISVGTTLANSTTISDPDSGAEYGIALTGTTGDGTWAYELSGSSTFTNVGTLSTNAALLLPATASLLYTSKGQSETATLTYCAWDQTSGTAGGTADLTGANATGGATAFSPLTAADTASLTVNDAPVLTPAQTSPSLGSTTVNTAATFSLTGTFINSGINTTTISDFDSNAVLGGIALTGIMGKGTWAYELSGQTTFTNISTSTTGTLSTSNALLLPATASLRYTPDGTDAESPTITYLAWDQPSGATGGNTVNLSAVNATGGTTAYSTASDTATLTVGLYANLSGYVYVDPSNSGTWTTSSEGLGGVTVKLLLQNSQGTFTEVAGKSPIQTSANGSYSFNDLVAGTYQIQETRPPEFVDGQSTVGSISGTTSGTSPQADVLQVTVSTGQNGTGYNFAVLGVVPQMISLRLFLTSTPTTGIGLMQILQTAPSVNLAGSAGSTATTNFSTTFSASGPAIAIASSAASITSLDSPTLASMIVTLANPQDAGEQLQFVNTDTSIISSNINGVLTLSGVADTSTYLSVLQSITYSDPATPPTAGDRTIDVVVNDGTLSSATAVSTIFVDPPGSATTQSPLSPAAVDAALEQNTNWAQ